MRAGSEGWFPSLEGRGKGRASSPLESLSIPRESMSAERVELEQCTFPDPRSSPR